MLLIAFVMGKRTHLSMIAKAAQAFSVDGGIPMADETLPTHPSHFSKSSKASLIWLSLFFLGMLSRFWGEAPLESNNLSAVPLYYYNGVNLKSGHLSLKLKKSAHP